MNIDGTIKKTIEEKHSYKKKQPDAVISIIDLLLEKQVQDRLAKDQRQEYYPSVKFSRNYALISRLA